MMQERGARTGTPDTKASGYDLRAELAGARIANNVIEEGVLRVGGRSLDLAGQSFTYQMLSGPGEMRGVPGVRPTVEERLETEAGRSRLVQQLYGLDETAASSLILLAALHSTLGGKPEAVRSDSYQLKDARVREDGLIETGILRIGDREIDLTGKNYTWQMLPGQEKFTPAQASLFGLLNVEMGRLRLTQELYGIDRAAALSHLLTDAIQQSPAHEARRGAPDRTAPGYDMRAALGGGGRIVGNEPINEGVLRVGDRSLDLAGQGFTLQMLLGPDELRHIPGFKPTVDERLQTEAGRVRLVQQLYGLDEAAAGSLILLTALRRNLSGSPEAGASSRYQLEDARVGGERVIETGTLRIGDREIDLTGRNYTWEMLPGQEKFMPAKASWFSLLNIEVGRLRLVQELYGIDRTAALSHLMAQAMQENASSTAAELAAPAGSARLQA